MSAYDEVTKRLPEAYADRFNGSDHWFVCDRPGGEIIGIGEGEAGAWQNALQSLKGSQMRPANPFKRSRQMPAVEESVTKTSVQPTEETHMEKISYIALGTGNQPKKYVNPAAVDGYEMFNNTLRVHLRGGTEILLPGLQLEEFTAALAATK